MSSRTRTAFSSTSSKSFVGRRLASSRSATSSSRSTASATPTSRCFARSGGRPKSRPAPRYFRSAATSARARRSSRRRTGSATRCSSPSSRSPSAKARSKTSRARLRSSSCSPIRRAPAQKPVKWTDHEELMKLPEAEKNPAIVAQARALAERLRQLVDSRRRGPRRHRRAPAGLHACGRIRGGASALRPRALCGGRTGLLVAATGRGPPAHPRHCRQPARRRNALRRPRLPRRRGDSRHALAAAGSRGRQATSGLLWRSASVAKRRATTSSPRPSGSSRSTPRTPPSSGRSAIGSRRFAPRRRSCRSTS